MPQCFLHTYVMSGFVITHRIKKKLQWIWITQKKIRMKSEPNKAMDKKNINKMDMVFTEKQF